MSDSLVDLFELEILRGRARWIADLNETFRDHSVGKHKFDLYARGQTRGKGFMLSQFFAWTVLPNYKVALYARSVKDSASFLRSSLLELIQEIRKEFEKYGLKWAWLVLFFEGDPPERIRSAIEDYQKSDIGIGTVNAYSGSVVVSNNVLGRSLTRQMRLHKLVSELEYRKGRKGSAS